MKSHFLCIVWFFMASRHYFCNNINENKFLEFRNLHYSISFHMSPVLERSIVTDYEYIIQGRNKYMCSIDLLKKYTESEFSSKLLGENLTANVTISSLSKSSHHSKTYDDLLDVLSGFKNKCSAAVPIHNFRYIYIICYYRSIRRFQFLENFEQDVTNIGQFVEDKVWSSDELNMKNINMDSLVTTEGSHIQTYVSNVTCPNNKFNLKENYFKTTLKFQCNSHMNITKVVSIVELTPCHTEITLLTNSICQFPVFSHQIQSTNEPSSIDCYPMIPNKYADLIDLVTISRAEHPRDTLLSVLSKMPARILLPFYTKLSLLSQKEAEILKNTKFVTQIAPDLSEVLTSETSGKIKADDFKTKIRLHKTINLMSNKFFKQNMDKEETLRYLESLNITQIYEDAKVALNNSLATPTVNNDQHSNITVSYDNDDVFDEIDDDLSVNSEDLSSLNKSNTQISHSQDNEAFIHDFEEESLQNADSDEYIEFGDLYDTKEHF